MALIIGKGLMLAASVDEEQVLPTQIATLQPPFRTFYPEKHRTNRPLTGRCRTLRAKAKCKNGHTPARP